MIATAESETGLGVRGRDARATAVVAVTLFLVTLAVFGRTVTFDFVNYDDDVYVYQNPHVTGGLSWDNVKWAFTTGHASNWHPLTWLSLQADVSLLGSGAAGHHAVNVVLHAGNAALLFLALSKMTGARWPSALCAALFAWHPLRAESVAWVAERKDVLCGLFWMLTLLAYARYARRRTILSYLSVAAAVALSLLAKPMAVTLPLVLLLLDYWPLRRGGWAIRTLEKLPLLALSAAAAGATLWAQRRGGAMTGEAMSVSDRLITAGFAYGQYLIATFWPAGLAPFYPHPQQPPETGLPWPTIALSLLIVAALLAVAVAAFRRAPWCSVGIFWYFGTLVPVIGLVQVGLQSHADRYTYLPSIGLGIALAWSADAIAAWRNVTVAAGMVCIVFAGLAVRQVGFWRDSTTLWRHAIDVVPRNYIAHGNLGHALHARGDAAGAMEQFRRSIEINPRYGQGLHNYGAALAAAGRDEDALPYLRRALEVGDTRQATLVELDRLYQRLNQPAEAIALHEARLRRDPSDPAALHGLATLRAQRGEVAAAIDLWGRAAAVKPDDAEIRHSLGLALVLTGRHAEGVGHLRAADSLRPGRPETLTWLAWTLATSFDDAVRRPAEALECARRATAGTATPPVTALDALAAAEAATGRFEDAVATVDRAIGRAESLGQADVAASLRERRALYQRRQAYVQPSP